MGRIGCRMVGKFGECQLSFLKLLSIMVEDKEVWFECLDSQLTKCVSLWMVGSRKAQVYVKLSIKFEKGIVRQTESNGQI